MNIQFIFHYIYNIVLPKVFLCTLGYQRVSPKSVTNQIHSILQTSIIKGMYPNWKLSFGFYSFFFSFGISALLRTGDWGETGQAGERETGRMTCSNGPRLVSNPDSALVHGMHPSELDFKRKVYLPKVLHKEMFIRWGSVHLFDKSERHQRLFWDSV